MEKYKHIISDVLSVYAPKDVIFNALTVPNGKKYKGIDFCINLKKLPIHIDSVKSEYIESLKIEGNFLNIKLNRSHIFLDLYKKINHGTNYGTSIEGIGANIVVEYSSPNVAKEFHAGHLRSTIIGEFIKRIHLNFGYNVHTINYVGDWGKQFGLLILSYKNYGNSLSLDEDPIKHLFDLYVLINKKMKVWKEEDLDEYERMNSEAEDYLKQLEEGDSELMELWFKIREASIKKYEKTYEKMGIKFDEYASEAFASKGVPGLIFNLSSKNLLFEDKGAMKVNLESENLGKPVITKKQDTSIYMSRDLVEAQRRYTEQFFDKMYYVVGESQAYHFQQVFTILKKMHYDWADNCHHIGFGNVIGMSARKGTGILLEDMIQEAKKQMYEKMRENPEKFSKIKDPKHTALVLGLSAIYVQDLSANRKNSYHFDWKRIKSFTGRTGPAIQYAYARICGIIRKCGIEYNEEVSMYLFPEGEAYDLAKHILLYEEILHEVLETLDPSKLIRYMLDLAHYISLAHKILKVKDQSINVAQSRLYLFNCGKIVLGKCIRMIGLEPLESM